MSGPAIEVRDLGKQYQIGGPVNRYRTLRESLSEAVTRPIKRLKSKGNREQNSIWALRGISFDVQEGQVLGVIGRNGAGKSTLLKILSRVTEPTEGYAKIRGRIGSLLEVGTGFHPELTGRENIQLNGAILGMRRQEIDSKFDAIVEFSGVEKFIDTPVKRYSSGMYLRLAFAVAAHLEPDILVVDEVLAVGDAEFQRKCLGKMSDVAQAGRTVLFVSHSMSSILRLTHNTLVLENGKVVMEAPTQEAVDYYLSSGYSQTGERHWFKDEIPPDSAPFFPEALRVKDARGHVSDTVRAIEPITLEFEYQLAASIQGLRVGFYLMTTNGEIVFTSFDTDVADLYEQFATRPPGHYVSRAILPPDMLNEGRYVIGVNASVFRMQRYFQDESALAFNIDLSGAPGTQWAEVRLGSIRPRLDWQIEQIEPIKSATER
jgi:lipopolysaccharide transport system ATP-binding protein